MSYDEDVYDYELSDEETKSEKDANNEEEFDAKEAYMQLKRYAARQRKSKDVTPESDYASESNFPQKETKSQEDQEDTTYDNNKDIREDNDMANSAESVDEDEHEDEDSEQSCDMYEEFNLSILKTPLGHFNNESDVEEYDDDAEKDSQNGEDFLTTTFTWSLRNKPKLNLTDKENNNVGNDDDDDADNAVKDSLLKQNDEQQIDVVDKDKVIVEQEKSLNNSEEVLSQKHCKASTPEKEQQKMDKLERFWPWADREKIIYKQSTCHLVPQKPLGLIEQRIQLLAKRNLLEHINRIKNPQ